MNTDTDIESEEIPEEIPNARNADASLHSFAEFGARVAESNRRREEEWRAFMTKQPQSKRCQQHPDVACPISLDATREATRYNLGERTAGYEPCPNCAQEQAALDERKRLRSGGVMPANLHCTLDNWTPDDDEAKRHLQIVREFTTIRRGFLLLLGNVGTGKTHLAVGAMRHFPSARLFKQNTLLRLLRQTYRDRTADDPISMAQETGLFVLDEAGVTGGGRDEFSMLYEILDYRHCHQKPTIITSNLDFDSLCEDLGGRLADRLRESAFMVLIFSGASHRGKARQAYFEQSAQQGAEPTLLGPYAGMTEAEKNKAIAIDAAG